MDSHRIKGFYIKAFVWQNKGFFIEKNIYTENKEKIKVNFLSTSKLRPTFIFF